MNSSIELKQHLLAAIVVFQVVVLPVMGKRLIYITGRKVSKRSLFF